MEKRFVAPLTEPEQQTLTSTHHHGEKRALRRRAHAILLSDQGHTINQISENFRFAAMPYHDGSSNGKCPVWMVSSTNRVVDEHPSSMNTITSDCKRW